MKKKLSAVLSAVMLFGLLVAPAQAMDYTFDGPLAGDFGTPTSDDTIYPWEDPNVDRGKDTALIPPGFGTPTGPGNNDPLLPSNPGDPNPGTPDPGDPTTPPMPDIPDPTPGTPAPAFTELTPDLYYSDGSLGTLRIPSIGLTVKIFEGTGSAPLLKGAGHFTGTTAWNGNYCVAGHNRGVRNDFGKIHLLKSDAAITLTTPLGTRTYAVTSVSKVSVNDVSGLNPTDINMITLYTCVNDQPAYRWCVRAVEQAA